MIKACFGSERKDHQDLYPASDESESQPYYFSKDDFPFRKQFILVGWVQKEKHSTYKMSLCAATALKRKEKEKKKKKNTTKEAMRVTTKSVQLDVFLPCYE